MTRLRSWFDKKLAHWGAEALQRMWKDVPDGTPLVVRKRRT